LSRFDTAIALRPDHPAAFYNRGNALRDLQRPAEAVESYDRVIALQPKHAEAYNNRGAALADAGQPEAALASYACAIALRPNFAEAHNNYGNALAELGRIDEALNSYTAALALRPDHAIAHKNRAAALAALGELDDALASCDRAIALRPDYAEAHADRAATLICLGRVEQALRDSDQAIALKPDAVEARFNKGVCHLALGDFQPGWEGFEWRWKSRFGPPHPKLPGAHWHGETAVDGKTVLVVAEQGAGDSLQFCRYLPMLAQRARVVLAMPRPLTRLMARLPGIDRVISADDPLPPFDAWVPIMTLPMAFGTTLETIPAPIPYLRADSERTARWRQRLGNFPGRKIGLVWAGSPFSKLPRAQAMDRRRSITLAHYAPLGTLPGLCLVSLQKGEAGGQPKPGGMTLHDWTDELGDYADTADLVAALDLVISVDTSVVHLAGGLGKPVWVLNRFDQCWRWLQDRTDSPWYPTARLFRQPAPGDWSGVIRDVVAALMAPDQYQMTTAPARPGNQRL
jgi:Flp pilus assembly protein TadD